jgi:recombination protein RecA
VKVVKNKMAPPFAKVEFDLMYGEGISLEGDILDLAVKKDLIEKSGAWYSINGERMGQGRDAAKSFLREHSELRDELREKILVAYGVNKADPKADATSATPGKEEKEEKLAEKSKSAASKSTSGKGAKRTKH